VSELPASDRTTDLNVMADIPPELQPFGDDLSCPFSPEYALRGYERLRLHLSQLRSTFLLHLSFRGHDHE